MQISGSVVHALHKNVWHACKDRKRKQRPYRGIIGREYTCNLKNVRLQITFDYMKNVIDYNRLRLQITITPCLQWGSTQNLTMIEILNDIWRQHSIFLNQFGLLIHRCIILSTNLIFLASKPEVPTVHTKWSFLHAREFNEIAKFVTKQQIDLNFSRRKLYGNQQFILIIESLTDTLNIRIACYYLTNLEKLTLFMRKGHLGDKSISRFVYTTSRHQKRMYFGCL